MHNSSCYRPSPVKKLKTCILFHVRTLGSSIANLVVPTQQGAGDPELGYKSDPLALGFSGPEDAVNFARNGIEDSNRWSGRDAVRFVKRYAEGEACIVFNMTAGLDHCEYDLVFGGVIEGVKNPSAARNYGPVYHHTVTNNAHRHQEAVLIGIAELVEGPKGIIPLLMWLERPKERTDLRRQVFAPTLNVRIKINDAVPERKVSVLGFDDSRPHGYGISTLIKAGSKRFDGLDGSVGPTVRNLAVKLKGMDRNALRINLTNVVTWFTFKEGGDTLFKSTDLFLCAG
jgi:hypothetical protein